MKAIIIGAGRGSRLGHLTEDVPKTMVEVVGRTMLDQILDALAFAGFARKDIVFICGYRAEVVKAAHPDLTYVENTDWANNNILLSLLTARSHLTGGFVSTYADIVYSPAIAKAVRDGEGDLVLGCDTAWRRRYEKRSQHPETDAEKLVFDGPRVTRLSRHIPSEEASGEFIGVLKATPRGAARLVEAFDEAQAAFAGKVFREGRTFEKAYLIDLLARMLEAGVELRHADTPGGYMEIDTLEDRSLAAEWWASYLASSP
ncbi:MAG: NTP transferase domain-containing protein [Polyangiaceae bacterium]